MFNYIIAIFRLLIGKFEIGFDTCRTSPKDMGEKNILKPTLANCLWKIMSQIGLTFASNSIDFVAVSIEFVDKQYALFSVIALSEWPKIK